MLHLPLSLELEAVQSLRVLHRSEVPQMQLVVGGGRHQRALVHAELGVQHRLAGLVPHVSVDPGPA